MLNKSRAKFNGVPKRQDYVNFQAALANNPWYMLFYFFNLYVYLMESCKIVGIKRNQISTIDFSSTVRPWLLVSNLLKSSSLTNLLRKSQNCICFFVLTFFNFYDVEVFIWNQNWHEATFIDIHSSTKNCFRLNNEKKSGKYPKLENTSYVAK